jgi:predicted nuclease with TOPRIM domain
MCDTELMLQVKLDRILDTIHVMKSYFDLHIHGMDKVSSSINSNWVEVKLSSLDGLALLPEVIHAREVREKNLKLSESLREKKDKYEDLLNQHLSLIRQKENLEEKCSQISADSQHRSEKILQLEKECQRETLEHQQVSQLLAGVKEAERARLFDLETVSCQTEPDVVHSATQTEFIVPPVVIVVFIFLSLDPRSHSVIALQPPIVFQLQILLSHLQHPRNLLAVYSTRL